MAEVITTDGFSDWFRGLDEADREKVAHYIELLEQVGVNLDHPYTSAINGSRMAADCESFVCKRKGDLYGSSIALIDDETPSCFAAAAKRA